MVSILIIPGFERFKVGLWRGWLGGFSDRVWVRTDRRSADLATWSRGVRRALSGMKGGAWIVAHDFGCLAAVQAGWDHADRVEGALLVSPADPASFGVERLVPDRHLGFPSVVALESVEKARAVEHWAECWGSHVTTLAADIPPNGSENLFRAMGWRATREG